MVHLVNKTKSINKILLIQTKIHDKQLSKLEGTK